MFNTRHPNLIYPTTISIPSTTFTQIPTLSLSTIYHSTLPWPSSLDHDPNRPIRMEMGMGKGMRGIWSQLQILPMAIVMDTETTRNSIHLFNTLNHIQRRNLQLIILPFSLSANIVRRMGIYILTPLVCLFLILQCFTLINRLDGARVWRSNECRDKAWTWGCSCFST